MNDPGLRTPESFGERRKTRPGTYEWVAKKMPTYCRQHGKRIIGFLNGLGMCKDCLYEVEAQIEDNL